MSDANETIRRKRGDHGLPGYLHHDSFRRRSASRDYSADILNDQNDYESGYMPDEVTRDHAKRMHYAAFRAATAQTASDRQQWMDSYHRLRDRIVLGNRKLIYRAVRRRMATCNRADDLIGDCHIVLIQAVAAFNPWLGIRFSTYAYTCLVRALSRAAQKLSADLIGRSVSLDAVSEIDGSEQNEELISSGNSQLDEFFRDDHPLLTQREKLILLLRFRLREETTTATRTLETVGKELGLSKERVRQVQAGALEKLRQALGA